MDNPLLAFENLHPDDLSMMQKKITGKLDYSKPIVLRWKDEYERYLWFEEYATPIYKGEIIGIQGVVRCMEDKVRLQKKLEHQVFHDSLTGIYNRYYFEREMEVLDKSTMPIGIILCDLDNLKDINDTYGHKAGDSLIMDTANLLNSFVSDKTNLNITRIGEMSSLPLFTKVTKQE